MAYYSKRCEYKGMKFDSELELEYYKKLERMKEKGLIKDFFSQVSYLLQEEFIDFEGKKVKKIEHIPDYKIVLNNNQEILVDVKGDCEDLAVLKRKLFMYQNPTIPYYFVSKLPRYLGGVWVEVSKGVDLRGKLKNKYTKLNGKWTRNSPKWNVENWKEFFEIDGNYGLFYSWIKTKKISKKK